MKAFDLSGLWAGLDGWILKIVAMRGGVYSGPAAGIHLFLVGCPVEQSQSSSSTWNLPDRKIPRNEPNPIIRKHPACPCGKCGLRERKKSMSTAETGRKSDTCHTASSVEETRGSIEREEPIAYFLHIQRGEEPISRSCVPRSGQDGFIQSRT